MHFLCAAQGQMFSVMNSITLFLFTDKCSALENTKWKQFAAIVENIELFLFAFFFPRKSELLLLSERALWITLCRRNL